MVERILITGAGGMLGRDLARVLAGRQLTLLDHAACEVTDAKIVESRIAAAGPEVVVHLAAFTKVNECERDPIKAFRVNAEGTRNVARAAASCGARLIYMSTDYVFDGKSGTPYQESDPVLPLNVYGRSKLEGEHQAAAFPGTLIVRGGWLFGRGGRNFVEAILAQAREGKRPKVVTTQVGTPTWTAHLGRTIAALLDRGVAGVVHVPAGGSCSWFEFAQAIVEEAGLSVEVEPNADEPSGTPRPAFSVLSDARLRELGIDSLPHWRDGLRGYLAN